MDYFQLVVLLQLGGLGIAGHLRGVGRDNIARHHDKNGNRKQADKRCFQSCGRTPLKYAEQGMNHVLVWDDYGTG